MITFSRIVCDKNNVFMFIILLNLLYQLNRSTGEFNQFNKIRKILTKLFFYKKN
jgi:hypothetical protein